MSRQQAITRAQVEHKIADAKRRSRDALDSITTPVTALNVTSVEEKLDVIRRAYSDQLAWERVLDALP